jgi:hypothetical protein
MRCADFDAAWPAVDPGEPLSAAMAAHLAACRRCRGRAAADPSRLFALLRQTSPEAGPAWEPFWASTAVRAARRSRERRARRAWAAASAAALVLAGALWLLRGGAPGVAPLGAAHPVNARRLETPPEAAPGVVAASALPTLESIASPGARVVNFKIFGQEDKVTEVILIFDEGIDL